MIVGRFRLGMRTLKKQQLLSCCVFFLFQFFPSWLTYDCLFSRLFFAKTRFKYQFVFLENRALLETHWVAF